MTSLNNLAAGLVGIPVKVLTQEISACYILTVPPATGGLSVWPLSHSCLEFAPVSMMRILFVHTDNGHSSNFVAPAWVGKEIKWIEL